MFKSKKKKKKDKSFIQLKVGPKDFIILNLILSRMKQQLKGKMNKTELFANVVHRIMYVKKL